MTKEAEFIRKLKELMKVPIITFAAKVLEVDEETATLTVEPLDGRPKVFDVRIKSTVDSVLDGLFIFPAVDSVVLIGLIGNDKKEAYLVKCNHVAKVIIKIGENIIQFDDNGLNIDFEGRTLLMDDAQVTFDGGSNGGLIKIEDLNQIINTLQNDVNSLKQVFITWVPVPQDGGAALKSAIASYASQQLQVSQSSDYVNDIIKH